LKVDFSSFMVEVRFPDPASYLKHRTPSIQHQQSSRGGRQAPVRSYEYAYIVDREAIVKKWNSAKWRSGLTPRRLPKCSGPGSSAPFGRRPRTKTKKSGASAEAERRNRWGVRRIRIRRSFVFAVSPFAIRLVLALLVFRIRIRRACFRRARRLSARSRPGRPDPGPARWPRQRCSAAARAVGAAAIRAAAAPLAGRARRSVPLPLVDVARVLRKFRARRPRKRAVSPGGISNKDFVVGRVFLLWDCCTIFAIPTVRVGLGPPKPAGAGPAIPGAATRKARPKSTRCPGIRQ
jgi:hypothetical protein